MTANHTLKNETVMDPRLAEIVGPGKAEYHEFWHMFERAVASNATGRALVCLEEGPHRLSEGLGLQADATAPTHLSWTYTELDRASERLSMKLSALGIVQGSVIAVFLLNTADYILLFWAAARLRATFVPLSPQLLGRGFELKSCFEAVVKVDMVVVQEPQDANALDSILDDTIQQNLSLKVLCDGEVAAIGWTSLKAVVEYGSDIDKAPPRFYAENIPVTILFTSGSTSTPKACGHSARFWSAATHARTVSCRLSKDSRVILHTPPFHILGLGDMLATVKAGATVIMPAKRFNPTASLRAITEQGCTHVSCTSSIIDSMSRELGGQSLSTKLSSLEVINMTAGVLGTDILERTKRVLSSQRVIAFWGMTKTLFSLL